MGESANLRRNIKDFRNSTEKIAKKISGVGDIWKDRNYASLQKQMGALQKSAKSVIKGGENTGKYVDMFFGIAGEKIK